MSEIINWTLLKNHGDERLEFEHFCFHVASCMFEDYGKMEYFYNTPGSEFYIELKKPLTFGGKTYNQGDVLGWQAKYWRGTKDDSILLWMQTTRKNFERVLTFQCHIVPI